MFSGVVILEMLYCIYTGSVVGALAEDSSNIVSLVKDQYNSLIKTVELHNTGLPDHVKVVIRNNCSR